jgi:hypothetical protein
MNSDGALLENYDFVPANARWFGKPLIDYEGCIVPGELGVLRHQLRADEQGAWVARMFGRHVPIVDLEQLPGDKFRHVQTSLPAFVEDSLADLKQATGQSGCIPDLLLWNDDTKRIRFIEIKGPSDRIASHQIVFAEHIRQAGYEASVISYRFATAA